MEVVYKEKKRTKLFGLPLHFVTYRIGPDKINIQSGFLTIVEDDAYMYKVQDVRLTRSFLERVFCLGTVTCYTGDKTHPELKLVHIRKSSGIKDYLMEASEEARRKRRAMHILEGQEQKDVDEDDVEDEY